MQEPEKKQKKKWVRLTVSSLEADVAYFDARLALLNNKKSSYYQLAQLRAYTELGRVLSEILARLQARPKQPPATPTASGIEVIEADSQPLNGVLAEEGATPTVNDTSPKPASPTESD
ncbi:hypothetical protein [Sedimenticola sp.]|uniref:hypothetical protein n=1 Tax=Sedimenticola sp. TaxID=1940285 RepID=UPI003D0F064D